MSALGPGTVVAGDFRILRPLNAGGMGAVYVALQISTHRERALKVMLGELATNDELKSRFVQEATIGSQIASDHAVEVVAAGIDPATGAPWLAMELLEGEDLAHFLAKSGPMSPAWVLDLFEQMTHALGAAHEHGIVHRDLKPENVFLARSRRANQSFMVKVLDFGIAKLLGAAKSSATAAVGTPLWMAPEQTQASHAIAPTADVWAMGLIAFRALTGRVYWRTATDPNASSMMILREVVFEPIGAASDRAREIGGAALPPGFDAWFARCVNRDPAGRFPDARAMHAELRAVLQGAALHPAADPHAAWQATHLSPGHLPGAPSAQVLHVSQPVYAQAQVAQAPSFVTVPPVVQSFTGGGASPSLPGGAVGPPPPPPPARRKKSQTGLYAGLGLGAAALVVVGIVVGTSGSSSKKSDASSGPSKSSVAPAKSTPPPQPETPFAALQAWDGFYVCGQGKTNLTLRVESVAGRTVNVVFDFFVPTSGVRGSFKMAGPYDPATRKLKLKPGAWVQRPPNYETVPIEGVVSPDGATYAGRVLNPRCSTFTTTLGAGGAAPGGGPAPAQPVYPPAPAPAPAAPAEPMP
jgi:serine/threonine protein kinase